MFPDKLKIAKVVPLDKKYDKTLRKIIALFQFYLRFQKFLINMFRHIYKYFTINNMFYKRQYGFRQKKNIDFRQKKI